MSLSSLTEDQQDALKEIINIGAGTATRVLSEMMDGAPISLGIPDVKICNSSDLNRSLEDHAAFAGTKLDFHGACEGSTILVFSEDSANRIVAHILEEMDEEGEVQAMRESTLSEIGNIIVSSLMGTIANMITKRFEYSLPVYTETSLSDQFKSASGDATIISADVDFEISSIKAECVRYIVFLGENVEEFIEAVFEFFEGEV